MAPKITSVRAGSSALPNLGLVIICLVVIGLAIRLFLLDHRVVRHLAGTTNDRIAALSTDGFDAPRPISARSSRDLMMSCGRILTIAPSLKADAALARRVAQGCAATAQALLDTGPSNAGALTVLLLASDSPTAQLYRHARDAAPYDAWALNLRLIALSRSALSGGALPAPARSDIASALSSDWGRATLARLYRDRIALRPVITDMAGKAPPEAQRDFLQRLDRLARRAS